MSKPEMPMNISEMPAVSTLRSRWHFAAPVPLEGETGFRGAAVDVEVPGLRSTLPTYPPFIAQLKFRTASEWAVKLRWAVRIAIRTNLFSPQGVM